MKTIKTIDAVIVYNLLKSASLGKMDATDKFSVIKTIKSLKHVSEDFESFRDDASERLKGEEHDDMQQKALMWQQKGDDCGLTDDEKIAVNKYYDKYGKELNECINEESQKENELDIRTLKEDAFGKLLEANDKWTVEQILKIDEVMSE